MSDTPDPYKIWQEKTTDSSVAPVVSPAVQIQINQPAYRSYKVIALFLIIGFLILCGSIWTVRYYSDRRSAMEHIAKADAEAAAKAIAAKEEQLRVATETKKEAERKIAEDAANAKRDIDQKQNLIYEKSRLVTEWVSTSSRLSEKKQIIAIAAFDGTNKSNRALATRLSSLFASQQLVCDPGIFTERYLVSEITASPDETRILNNPLFNPTDYCAGIVVCSVSTLISKVDQPISMIAADTTVSLRIFTFGAVRENEAWSNSFRGLGFKESDAIENSFARAEPKLRSFATELSEKLHLKQHP